MQELKKILEEIEVHKKIAYEKRNFDFLTAFKICQDIIRKHMSGKDSNVHTNDGWIPVKERLPEEAGTYIITALEGKRTIVTFAKWHSRYKRFDMTGSRAYWIPIAWMPIPEPYRQERSDNHDGE